MPHDQSSLLPLLVLWPILGLVGTAVMLGKNKSLPGRSIAFALFSLPHAVIFGPIFLLLMLMQQGQQQCPHCKMFIPADAAVCGKCTRELPKSDS